jgi:glycosyltransferase involved in cell wall biosynthesis
MIYIYFPGHIPLLAGLISALLKKRYALYVRGVWNTAGLMGVLSNYVFRNAAFIFTTGLGFAEQISTCNTNVGPVYPMTAFSPDVAVARKISANEHLCTALFVGHARERKGVLDVIRSISLARNRGVEVGLQIVGGGDEADLRKINSLVADLELGNHVEYLGHVSDPDRLAEYFSAADMFLYPSYYPEGFPRVVYEAMLFELPIICTILPGMRGFMKDQVNCIEVSPRQPEQIAKALLRLEKDSQFRKILGGAARETIENYLASFSIKGHANQFYEKYRAMLANG